MSARTPPARDNERWVAESLSTNGVTADVWSDSARRLLVLGYITAVTLPLIGLVLGIVIANRPTKANSKHGAWIIVVSIIASIVWILIIASGVFKLTSNDINS